LEDGYSYLSIPPLITETTIGVDITWKLFSSFFLP
jgi:hypothetical protein